MLVCTDNPMKQRQGADRQGSVWKVVGGFQSGFSNGLTQCSAWWQQEGDVYSSTGPGRVASSSLSEGAVTLKFTSHSCVCEMKWDTNWSTSFSSMWFNLDLQNHGVIQCPDGLREWVDVKKKKKRKLADIVFMTAGENEGGSWGERMLLGCSEREDGDFG